MPTNKRGYRTATVSLTLSFLTLACFLCINSASSASKAIYQSSEKQWAEQDILLTLYNVATPEEFSTINEKIHSLERIRSAHWYSTLRTVGWLPEEGFSAEFEEKGGFVAVEKQLFGPQVPLLRDGKRRVGVTILGLDDATFATYCATLGIESAPFYEGNHWRSILYHTVTDITTSTKRNPVPIPFLNSTPNDIMTLTETTIDSYDGDFTFDVEIVAIADQKLGFSSFLTSVKNHPAIRQSSQRSISFSASSSMP